MDHKRGPEALCLPSPKPNCLKGLQTRIQHLLSHLPSPIFIRKKKEGLTLKVCLEICKIYVLPPTHMACF